MNKLTKKDLAQVIKHDFTKELKDFEYETKFDISNKKLTSFQILKKIRSCFKNTEDYQLCEIKNGDKLLTKVSFFISDKIEYSTFIYRGARMVKIKHHKIINGKPFKIFKNDEKLIIDKGDFNTKLNDLKHRFKRHNHTLVNLDSFLSKQKKLVSIGQMTKERVKDFVVDLNDGRIYAIAISFCYSNGIVQKQLEIEYSGFLPSYNRPRKSGTEKEVIKGVQEVSNYIYQKFPKLFIPSIERKFSFVKSLKK